MSIADIFKIKYYKDRIRLLEADKEQLQNDKITLESQISELKWIIQEHSPLFDPDVLPSFSSKEDLVTFWRHTWRRTNHNNQYQLLRQDRALQAYLTPLRINPKTGTATFIGSDCTYSTSLASCQCEDFQRHFRPCKHIYRLAYELEIFMQHREAQTVHDPSKIFSEKTISQKLSLLSSQSLEILEELLHEEFLIVPSKRVEQLFRSGLVIPNPQKYDFLDSFYKDQLLSVLPPGASVKKSLKKSLLIELIISDFPEVIDELESQTISIILSPYASRLNGNFHRLHPR